MKQHKFRNYQGYVNYQLKMTRRKIDKDKDSSFMSSDVVESIYKYHKTKVEYGLCHGVRNGKEICMFEEMFLGKWIGTEIVPELCNGKNIFNRDFDKISKSWIGRFDVIYSNSFDHSRNPRETLDRWVSCLSNTGRLYIEWTHWHNKLGRCGNKADCFSATKKEYKNIFEEKYKVEDILIVNQNRRGSRHTFVIH